VVFKDTQLEIWDRIQNSLVALQCLLENIDPLKKNTYTRVDQLQGRLTIAMGVLTENWINVFDLPFDEDPQLRAEIPNTPAHTACKGIFLPESSNLKDAIFLGSVLAIGTNWL
jgi:hypothetical protein